MNHKQLKIYWILLLKRYLQKPIFLLTIFLLLPLFTIGLKQSLRESKISLTVGICSEDKGSYANLIIKALQKKSQGLRFVSVPSRDALDSAIRSRRMDCGFVLKEYFTSQIKKQRKKNLIDCYTSPGSASTAIAKEYIHSEVFSLYAFDTMMNYIQKDMNLEYKDTILLRNKLSPIFQNYLAGDETFSFSFVTPDQAVIETTMMLPSYILNSAQKITGLFILLAAMMGSCNLYRDEKNYFFHNFRGMTRILANLANILFPSLLALGSSLITIWICEGMSFDTVLHLLLYTCLCTLYCGILHRVIPKEKLFTGMIPVILICAFLFCPIVIDFSVFLPEIAVWKWIFPPAYL